MTWNRRTKFGNKATGGYASKRESKRALDLSLLEKLGEISELREQVRYELVPKQDGERAVNYTADFVYVEKGQTVVEDSKGFRTQVFIIKRKLMLFRHGIKIKEV